MKNRTTFGKLLKHTDNEDRPKNDFYPTPPEGTETLLAFEKFEGKIWECASGKGHITTVLERRGYEVESSDLMAEEHGFGRPVDFLATNFLLAPNIVTNPPYKLLSEFIRHGIELGPEKLALHIPWQALLQSGRRKLLDEFGYPTNSYIFVPALKVDHGDGKPKPSAFNHAWCVWQPNYAKRNSTILKLVDWRVYVNKAQLALEGFS